MAITHYMLWILYVLFTFIKTDLLQRISYGYGPILNSKTHLSFRVKRRARKRRRKRNPRPTTEDRVAKSRTTISVSKLTYLTAMPT